MKNIIKKQTKGRRLEKLFKGSANHRRIDILLFVEKHKGSLLEDISEGLDANYKTVSQHTEKLVQTGLLNKQYIGRGVSHKLSPYGERFVKFINTF